MKMMKRAVSVLLLLSLCLGLVSSAGAVAISVMGGGSVSYSGGYGEDNKGIGSMAAVGDKLYLLYVNGKLTQYDLASSTDTVMGECLYTGGISSAEALEGMRTEKPDAPAVNLLYTEEGELFGVCSATGERIRLLDVTGAFAPQKVEPKLDMSALMEKQDAEVYPLTPTSVTVQDGGLFVTTVSYSTGEMKRLAARIDLKTGESRVFTTQHINELLPWKNGKLLCRIYDDANAFNPETGEALIPEYGLFDPATDTYEKLGSFAVMNSTFGGMSVSGLCVDVEKEAMYYAAGSRIQEQKVSSTEAVVGAYTGEGMFGGFGGGQTLYVNGYYIIGSEYEGLKVYKIDTTAASKGALRIFGEFGSEAHKSFSQNYPEIPVEVASDYNSGLEALTNAMVSESDTYDVLQLSMSYMPVERLVSKGYSLDLSQYPEIMEIVSQMDPQFQQCMMQDGKLYGVPVAASAYTYGVNMELWESLGLTRDDLPTTLPELLDFTANWVYDYGEDHADINLFNSSSEMRAMFFSLILDRYISHCQTLPEGLRFDTELFRKLVKGLESIDFTELETYQGKSGDDFWNRESLFDMYYTVTSFYNREGVEPLVLAMDEGMEPGLPLNVSVLIINPKTKRMDQAVKYLVNYLKNLEPESGNIVLFPDHNDPVERKNYEQDLQSLQNELDKQKQLLAAADDSKKAELTEEVTRLEEYLTEMQNNRYSVTAEQIQNYRQNIAPYLQINKQSVLYSADSAAQGELSKLLQQFMSGSMDTETFIREMDKRVRMMQLEDQ